MSAKIREAWESYRRLVIPADAPLMQIVESRRVFYAGFGLALSMVLEVGDERVSSEDGAAILDALIEECGQFRKDMHEGRA